MEVVAGEGEGGPSGFVAEQAGLNFYRFFSDCGDQHFTVSGLQGKSSKSRHLNSTYNFWYQPLLLSLAANPIYINTYLALFVR